MKIQTIYKNILRLGKIREDEYKANDTEIDFLFDFNERARVMWEEMGFAEISQKYMNGNNITETFAIADGDTSNTRTNVFTAIEKVEFKPTGSSNWQCLEKEKDCCDTCSCYSYGDFTFTLDSNTIKYQNAKAGDIRITYERPAYKQITTADYDNNIEITFIPDEHIKALYLYIAYMETDTETQKLQFRYEKANGEFKNSLYRLEDTDTVLGVDNSNKEIYG